MFTSSETPKNHPTNEFKEWQRLLKQSEAALEALPDGSSDQEVDLYVTALSHAEQMLLSIKAPDFDAVCDKLSILIENGFAEQKTVEQLSFILRDVRRLNDARA